MQLIIFGGLTGGLIFISITVGITIVAHLNNLSYSQILYMKPADYARPELAGVGKGILILNSVGIFLFPPLVFAYLADPHPRTYLGLNAPQKNSFFLIALITIIAAYFTVTLLAMINESLVNFLPKTTQKWIESGESDANGVLDNVLSLKNPKELLMALFLAGVLPAVGEELFFRGILQKLFIQIFRGAWPGIIVTAFFFSAFHMQFMGFLPRMALGIVLGSIYWYSGSILTSMLCHFVFNSISIFLIYFKVSDLDSKSAFNLAFGLIGLVSVALVIFLLNYLRKKSTTSYAREFPHHGEITIFDEPDHPA